MMNTIVGGSVVQNMSCGKNDHTPDGNCTPVPNKSYMSRNTPGPGTDGRTHHGACTVYTRNIVFLGDGSAENIPDINGNQKDNEK